MPYSDFSSFELADLENDLLRLLPAAAFSPASMYAPLTDPTLASPQAVNVIVFPASKTTQRENSLDLEKLLFQAGQVPAPGNVVTLTTPDGVARWYVCLKLDTLSPVIRQVIPISVWAIELPYTVTLKRPATNPNAAGTLNIWGVPSSVDANGYPTFATTATTLRIGLTSQYNPLGESVVGNLPNGQRSIYTYLNAPVSMDDALTLHGHNYIVSQINELAANGFSYALRLILTETGAPSYS